MKNTNQYLRQVGGHHYEGYAMQPIELFDKTKWNYFQSSVCRYTLRYKDKNGEEDLQKALHLCRYASFHNVRSDRRNEAHVIAFAEANNLPAEQEQALHKIDACDWRWLTNHVNNLINNYHNE